MAAEAKKNQGAAARYVSGNIRVTGGWGNSIEGVESSSSTNRGVWAQTVKLLVWNGYYHHNEADGLDFSQDGDWEQLCCDQVLPESLDDADEGDVLAAAAGELEGTRHAGRARADGVWLPS